MIMMKRQKHIIRQKLKFSRYEVFPLIEFPIIREISILYRYNLYKPTFSALAFIKSKYRSNLKNVEDGELMFNSLFNKKHADQFN